MEITLCGPKGCCPAVKLGKKAVQIGEKGNLVKLKAEEWNQLVGLIREGKLKEL